jgi:L-rhamnose isomerase
VECKLFGIGSEDYVVGSHEFYLSYALTHEPMLCLDMGHFHPTETIHDKISSVLTFQDELLLHVSRGIRWDSDHVVILNDDIRCLFQQIVRGNALSCMNIALDFFDGSINRIGAWVVGTRAAQKGILAALLEPTEKLLSLEKGGDGAAKLALLEECKTLPMGAVWDMFCLSCDTPAGTSWIDDMLVYDRDVIRQR